MRKKPMLGVNLISGITDYLDLLLKALSFCEHIPFLFCPLQQQIYCFCLNQFFDNQWIWKPSITAFSTRLQLSSSRGIPKSEWVQRCPSVKRHFSFYSSLLLLLLLPITARVKWFRGGVITAPSANVLAAEWHSSASTMNQQVGERR